MPSFFAAVVFVLVVSCVQIEGGGNQPECQVPQRPKSANPMTLSMRYCTNTALKHHKTDQSLKLQETTAVFKYEVTDIRSNLEYFFDSVHFVDENSNIAKTYKFLEKAARVLVVHKRAIPGQDGYYTRYLFVSQKLGAPGSGKPGSENFLTKVAKANGLGFQIKPNSIFPANAKVKRYDGTVADKTGCANAFVFLEFVEPLSVSQNESSAFKKYASQNWDATAFGISKDTSFTFTSEPNATVRFDCQRPRKANSGSDNGAGQIQLTTSFQLLQFLVAAMFIKSI